MMKVKTKIDTDQIVEIGECHLGVELKKDRIIMEGCNMLTIIENDFRKGNLRGIQNYKGVKF